MIACCCTDHVAFAHHTMLQEITKLLLDIVSRRRAHEPAAVPIISRAEQANAAAVVAVAQAKKITTSQKTKAKTKVTAGAAGGAVATP